MAPAPIRNNTTAATAANATFRGLLFGEVGIGFGEASGGDFAEDRFQSFEETLVLRRCTDSHPEHGR